MNRAMAALAVVSAGCGRVGFGISDGGGDDDAPRLSVGSKHTCVRADSGAIRCFGLGMFGQLGFGNTNNIGDDETPAQAGDVPVGGPVLAIATGEYHSCALLSTGTVRCWGDGALGRLGYGNTNSLGNNEPIALLGDLAIADVVEMDGGRTHTCARLRSGAVRCWGDGSFGRLGYGNVDDLGDDETLASVGDIQLGGVAVQITAGGYHTCALLDTAAVRCWGLNDGGQLGYGNTTNVGEIDLPDSVGDVILGGAALEISAGFNHTCARLSGGAVRCWGYPEFGKLGYGNLVFIGDDETPASAGDVPLGSAAIAISAGYYHTCAVLDTGAVRCWGLGDERLGYARSGDVGDDETPASVGDVPLGGVATEIHAALGHTCARLDTGAVRCWGAGVEGRLGYGNTNDIGDDEFPAAAGDVPIW